MTLFITHDIGLAYYVSDSVYIMETGNLSKAVLPMM
jgi:ABC-type dipeptide/oligopeptide/nickel transport system ATPase component